MVSIRYFWLLAAFSWRNVMPADLVISTKRTELRGVANKAADAPASTLRRVMREPGFMNTSLHERKRTNRVIAYSTVQTCHNVQSLLMTISRRNWMQAAGAAVLARGQAEAGDKLLQVAGREVEIQLVPVSACTNCRTGRL